MANLSDKVTPSGVLTPTGDGSNLSGILTPTGDGSGLTGLPKPHGPVAVSGATPSLDVGTYNFFQQGALTADTTISFASVPTDAKWQYSYVAAVDANAVFDLADASYASKSFSVASQDVVPTELAFNTDGTSMFIVGTSNDTIYQYTLSTAFDVSTASYASKSFSVSSQDTAPTGIAFNTDGTSMLIVGFTTDTIYQYTLSTAFDVSTASYSNKSFSVSSQEINPQALSFSTAGDSMFIVGTNADTVFQYTLASAYSLTLPTIVGTPSATATGDRVTYTFVTDDGGTTIDLIAEEIIQ